MPLHSTSAATEAILSYGIFGSGKSHGWGTIACYYRDTDTPGTFYVIGTEHGAIARMSDEYPDWDRNVVTEDVAGWLSLTALTDKYLGQVVPGDWIVIEGLGYPWEWVRTFYDQSRPGYKPPVQSNPFDIEVEPTRNWDSIKRVYYTWLNSILTSPAHVYSVAHAEPLRVEGGWADSAEAISLYKSVGMRAVTEKTAGYSHHSVLYMAHPKADQWTITTIDDHGGRPKFNNEPIADMVLTYLLASGWELTP